MSVTTMRISTMPSSDIGSVSRPVQEPQKQASKPLFQNKGLLLSDRNIFGRFSCRFCAFMTTVADRCENDTFFYREIRSLGYRGFLLPNEETLRNNP